MTPRAEIDGVEMWVVSAEHLILSKLDWARSSRSEVQLPGITGAELRVQIFERTYGNDFQEADRARTARRIRGGPPGDR